MKITILIALTLVFASCKHLEKEDKPKKSSEEESAEHNESSIIKSPRPKAPNINFKNKIFEVELSKELRARYIEPDRIKIIFGKPSEDTTGYYVIFAAVEDTDKPCSFSESLVLPKEVGLSLSIEREEAESIDEVSICAYQRSRSGWGRSSTKVSLPKVLEVEKP